MSTVLTIIGAGVTWLIVAFIGSLILCRAAAIGDAQAEVIHLRPLHLVEDEPEHDGVVIPFDRGTAA